MTSTARSSGPNLYRRLLGYAWPYRGVFALAVAAMTVASATDPAFAALMRPMLDGGFIHRNPESIRYVPLLLIALFTVRGIAAFGADYSMQWVGRKVIFDIRNAMFSQMVYLPSAFYDVHSSGTLVSKLIYDVEQVASASTRAVSVLVKDGVGVVGLLGWMTYLDWKLTLIFVCLAPPVSLVVRKMSTRFRKASSAIQETMGDVSRVAQETIAAHKVVKIFGGEEIEKLTFARINERNRQQVMKRAAVGASGSPIIQLLAATALAGIIYIAMQQPKITIGTFVSYITAIMLLLGPTRRLTQINETIQSGLAAAQSIFWLLDQPMPRDKGTRRLESVRGRIEYRHVTFCYPSSRVSALANVSFVAEPGTTLALVGPSGSGKTTVANVLPRFYDLSEGEILIDGLSITDMTIKSLRSHIALVGQETVLFDDTIRNNIVYGQREPVTDARLQDAAAAAHVMEFVRDLPNGFDTLVGERGVRLSGGQRQRIAIARALLKNAPILILDEATSALDTESERYVQEAMQKLMANRTTLVIAHRLSTIEGADRIVVLANGRIVESGTHQELLDLGQAYARLYRVQFRER
ncbi:MAG: lipid A export permease/ATP-binding protein MsbA [Acidiferrobacteraceae bacterium]